MDKERVLVELSDCVEILEDIDSAEYTKAELAGLHGSVLSAIMDAQEFMRAQAKVTGETSDGYHTFNELYHHRAVLFSVIVSVFHDRAWKSKKHHDGTMFDGMFIVGIDTPDGQATYHYDIDPYWGMFNCRVLDNAPEWDGHTPAQAIERIGKLKAQEPPTVTECKDLQILRDIKSGKVLKSGCKEYVIYNGDWYRKRKWDWPEKAQEPVKVKTKCSTGMTHWYTCGGCDTSVNKGDKYCRMCGKVLVWG